MRLRKWEVHVTGTDNGEPYDDLRDRCFTKFGAHIAASRINLDPLTPKLLATRPEWKLTYHADVRRAT